MDNPKHKPQTARLTIAEAAAHYGISEAALWGRIEDGELEAFARVRDVSVTIFGGLDTIPPYEAIPLPVSAADTLRGGGAWRGTANGHEALSGSLLHGALCIRPEDVFLTPQEAAPEVCPVPDASPVVVSRWKAWALAEGQRLNAEFPHQSKEQIADKLVKLAAERGIKNDKGGKLTQGVIMKDGLAGWSEWRANPPG